LEQRTEEVVIYGKAGRILHQAVRMFNDRLLQKFLTSGSVDHKKVQQENQFPKPNTNRFVNSCAKNLFNFQIMPDEFALLTNQLFFWNGAVNRQNDRYWSDVNQHVFRETHTQFPQKINFCAGILGNRFVGPIFIDQNLTGELYLDMLQNEIYPDIQRIVRDIPGNFRVT